MKIVEHSGNLWGVKQLSSPSPQTKLKISKTTGMAHFKAYYSAIFWAKFEISTIFFVYCKFNGFNTWFCL